MTIDWFSNVLVMSHYMGLGVHEKSTYLFTGIPFQVNSGTSALFPEAGSFIFRIPFLCKIRLILLVSLKQIPKITNFLFNPLLPKEYNGSKKKKKDTEVYFLVDLKPGTTWERGCTLNL